MKPRARAGLVATVRLSLVLLVTSCSTPVVPDASTEVRIAGSTSMYPLLADLAAAYSESYPHVHLEIEEGGSRQGLDRVLLNETDLAACSWLPSDQQGSPQAYIATPVAWDGLAIIVHSGNSASGLTLLQVRSIYGGWTLDWEEIGGEEGDIIVVSREDGSGSRSVFEGQVMGEQKVTLTAIVMPSSRAVVDYVAQHRSAVGYVSMGMLAAYNGEDDGAAVGIHKESVKTLRIEGAFPTPDTVQTGVYHLTHPLYLVTRTQPGGLGQSFVDFALSQAGQAIIGMRYGRVR